MVVTAKDLSENSPADLWRTANPNLITSEMRSVERCKYDSKTNLYQYRNSYYEFMANDNSRLFSKTHLSNATAIFSYLSGDLQVLIPRLIQAINNANCAALFIPTSTNTRSLEHRSVSKDAVKILNTLLPHRIKRSALEINLKNTMPIFFHVSPSCPWKDSFMEVADE